MTSSRFGPVAGVLRLLAGLHADGLRQETWARLRALPELADLVGDEPDPDSAAADHQDLFFYRVHPHASLFLDDQRRIGGPVTDEAARQFLSAGFRSLRDDLAVDHLSSELDFLAYLLEKGDEHGARTFLDGHLGGWLIPVGRAIRNQPYEVQASLTEVLVELVVSIRSELGGPFRPPDGFALPERKDVLADPASGVRDIAAFLTTPAQAGFFVGRGDVVRLARKAEAPRGMGGAALMMENALRSAARYDAMDSLVAELDKMAADVRADWSAIGARVPWGWWTTAWTERIDATRAMLRDMSGRLES